MACREYDDEDKTEETADEFIEPYLDTELEELELPELKSEDEE